MKFNGMDPRSLHPALSISHEVPPGMAKRKIVTVEGTDGEIVSDVITEKGEYLVQMNIFGKSREQAWEVREILAGWAGSSGTKTAELVPTHRPQRCYDAIVSSISDPKFVRGRAVVDVVFMLPRPIARSTSYTTAQGAGALSVRIGGTLPARPVIRQTLAKDCTELVWTLNGAKLLKLKGSMKAGQVVEMDTRYERMAIDGVSAMAMIDPQKTEWRPGYAPGMREIRSTDSGKMEMRWHDEWL